MLNSNTQYEIYILRIGLFQSKFLILFHLMKAITYMNIDHSSKKKKEKKIWLFFENSVLKNIFKIAKTSETQSYKIHGLSPKLLLVTTYNLRILLKM